MAAVLAHRSALRLAVSITRRCRRLRFEHDANVLRVVQSCSFVDLRSSSAQPKECADNGHDRDERNGDRQREPIDAAVHRSNVATRRVLKASARCRTAAAHRLIVASAVASAPHRAPIAHLVKGQGGGTRQRGAKDLSLEALAPPAPSLSPRLEHECPNEGGGPPEPHALPGFLRHPVLAAEHDGRADAVRRGEDHRTKGDASEHPASLPRAATPPSSGPRRRRCRSGRSCP